MLHFIFYEEMITRETDTDTNTDKQQIHLTHLIKITGDFHINFFTIVFVSCTSLILLYDFNNVGLSLLTDNILYVDLFVTDF